MNITGHAERPPGSVQLFEQLEVRVLVERR